MRKALVCVVMSLSLILSAILPAFAYDPIDYTDDTVTITYIGDGYYIVTEISSDPIIQRSSSFTKTANTVVTVYNANDEIACQYTLFGEFQVVSGVSVVCTSATYTQNIYDTGWSFSNGQATKSGATAYGVGKFTKKVLFITTKEIEIDISFTCDIYGNVTSE